MQPHTNLEPNSSIHGYSGTILLFTRQVFTSVCCCTLGCRATPYLKRCAPWRQFIGGVQFVTALSGTTWRGQRTGDNRGLKSKFISGGAHPGGGLAVIGRHRWSLKMCRGGVAKVMTRAFFGTTDLLLILNQSMRIVLRCKENNIQKPQLTKIVSQGRKDTEGKRTQGPQQKIPTSATDRMELHNREIRAVSTQTTQFLNGKLYKRGIRAVVSKKCTYHHLDHLCIF